MCSINVFEKIWADLTAEAERMRGSCLKDLFLTDRKRASRLSLQSQGILLDFSRQLLDSRVMEILFDLAREKKVESGIKRFFSGECINNSENRPVLHFQLRSPEPEPEVAVEMKKMEAIARRIRNGSWKGYSGKKLNQVVVVGIGGSDLGPRMALTALDHLRDTDCGFHFINNLDGDMAGRVLSGLDPEVTLFLVVSKSFSTQETMINARICREWISDFHEDPHAWKSQFLAVTACPQKARQAGFLNDHIVKFWEWVGGRFSLASAVGLPLMMAVGPHRFADMLAGMNSMDRHFRTAPLQSNLPVIMALLGIWNSNFMKFAGHTVLPYSQALEFFPAFLQQLEMESNGKSVDREGNPLTLDSVPLVWGDVGTNGQHAFFQFLHQGTRVVSCDFIGFCQPARGNVFSHTRLLANMLAQSAALAFGRSPEKTRAAGVPAKQLPFRVFPGNRPSSVLLFDKLSPFSLGQLVALYEHKVFVQGIVWNINSFDQWGVELGKQLAGEFSDFLEGKEKFPGSFDSSSEMLVEFIRHGKKLN